MGDHRYILAKPELSLVDGPNRTERYLDYVTLMERLNLDIASEYLVMAATLVYIKSRMLDRETGATKQ